MTRKREWRCVPHLTTAGASDGTRCATCENYPLAAKCPLDDGTMCGECGHAHKVGHHERPAPAAKGGSDGL